MLLSAPVRAPVGPVRETVAVVTKVLPPTDPPTIGFLQTSDDLKASILVRRARVVLPLLPFPKTREGLEVSEDPVRTFSFDEGSPLPP